MTDFANIRRSTLKHWKTRSNRVFKTTDNINNSFECSWQNKGWNLGYNHISIFCSLGEFSSHISDLLRDYRYDRYNYDQSEEINELLFRYYSRILLIASEVLTDLQDLYILSNEKLTTKQMNGLKGEILRTKQDNARIALANGTNKIKDLLDFINKICKHKTSNFHLCNNHVKFLFEDFHSKINTKKKRISIGNINCFTSYNPSTLKKYMKPDYIVLPKLEYIIDLIINGYAVLDELFTKDQTKFDFICKHFDDK